MRGMKFPLWAYFLIEEGNFTRLLTFLIFTPRKCSASQLIEVIRFDQLTKRWQHKNFRIDKFSNFHGCPLVSMVSVDEEPYAIKSKVQGEKCSGIACSALRDFSSALNYTNQMIVCQDGYEKSTSFFHHLNIVPMFLNTFLKRYARDEKDRMVLKRVLYSFDEFIAIPPGEEFNGYEKLVLPFDAPT